MSELVIHEWIDNQAAATEAAYKVAQREILKAGHVLGDLPGLDDREDLRARTEEAITERIKQLEDLVDVIEIEDDHWRQAGEMVIAKVPPSSSKNQQFKDSLLWRQVLDQGLQRSVVLITKDKGFWNQKHDDLADELRAECQDVGADVRVVDGLTALLAYVQAETLSSDRLDDLRGTMEDAFALEVQERAWDQSVRPAHCDRWDEQVFLTENPGVLLVAVEALYPAVDFVGHGDDPFNDSLDFDSPYRWLVAEGTVLVDLEDESVKATVDAVSLLNETPHFSDKTEIFSDAPRPAAWGGRRVSWNL